MGSPYQSQSASGYNSSPPPDDGSTVSTNKITWATIKSKITDPVKTLADAVNTALRAALSVAPSTTSINYTTLVGDHLTTIEVSGTTTISLGDAATMIAQAMGYTVTVYNKGSNLVTVALATGTNKLNGVTNGTLVLPPFYANTFTVAQSGTDYETVQAAKPFDDYVCQGRLTLTSGAAVTTADVTAATSVFFTPFKGNRVDLYDGNKWGRFPFSELTLSVPATTSTMYDVFLVNSSGTLTLEALAWTNDTTRATALTTQDGVLVKTGATTRRYLGSFRTTGVSGQTEDSLAKRYVWNYYNRVRRALRAAVETTDTWTYTTATFRQANANTANQLDCVQGVAEDAVEAFVSAFFVNTNAGVVGRVGIGIDSTTVSSAQIGIIGQIAVANSIMSAFASYKGVPGAGRHTLAWLEFSDATGTMTWSGDSGSPLVQQSGINGMCYA